MDQNITEQLAVANELFNNKEYPSALGKYNAIIELDNKCHQAYFMKGRTVFMLKQPESTVFENYEKALALDPQNSEYIFVSGKSLFRQHKYQDAITYFDKAIKAEPNNIEYMVKKAESHGRLGDSAKQLGCCEQILSIAPTHKWALSSAIGILVMMGREVEAIALCDQIITADNKHAFAFAKKGNLFKGLEAVKYYDQALKIDPKTIEAWLGKGKIQMEKSHTDALTSFNKLLEIDPEHWSGNIYKGICLFKLNKFKEALPFLSKCEKSNNEYYYIIFIECLIATGDLTKAQSIFKSKNSYFSGDPDWAKVGKKLRNINTTSSPLKTTIKLNKIEQEWIKEITLFVSHLKKINTKPITAIIVEWDFLDDNDFQLQIIAESNSDLQTLEKNICAGYHIDDNNAVTKDYFTSVSSIIKSKKSFDKITHEIEKLPDYIVLNKIEKVFFSVQEHDTKVDYTKKIE
jgi:tetratricopeptide (TPR) repeat protein